MAEKLEYDHLHVILDALARLEEKITDGYDPTQTYVTSSPSAQGVFQVGSRLLSKAHYEELLAQASEVLTDLLGATAWDDTVVLEVRQPATPAESIF